MVRRTLYILLLTFVLPLVSLYSQVVDRDKKYNKKATKKERKADRYYTRQKFEKAMHSYEEAAKESLPSNQAAHLHLKTARLYISLLDYLAAIPHYDRAMELDENLFTSNDICNYLDALRYNGQKIKAIGIAIRYAYTDVYKVDQRYQNILHALNYEGGFLPLGTPEFNLNRIIPANSMNSQFWIGSIGNEYFYAESDSKYHDPNKRFYHRSSYHPLENLTLIDKDRKAKDNILSSIPIFLQNGPMTFSADRSKIIVTEVSYQQGEQVNVLKDGLSIFPTKLSYSEYNAKRNGWSAFKDAFPQKAEASYSHPHIFHNDRSILFSSNMEGGYGGFDIYVAHWNNETGAWGEPINLGPLVNTEGDEISPTLFDDLLIFASNGHVGFGGYDLYSIVWENGHIIKGSLHHFDYPINSNMNDFGMLRIDQDRGYIVSDRLRTDKDDIFYFERNIKHDRSNLLSGMYEDRAISSGAINFSGNKNSDSSKRNVPLPIFTSTELLLSIYFDFDRYSIKDTELSTLYRWLEETDFSNIEYLIIDGYADEMGGETYNFQLSQKRAQAISHWLLAHGIKVKMSVTGKGQIIVEPSDNEATPLYTERPINDFSFNNRIWQTRTARRVDIKAVVKQ